MDTKTLRFILTRVLLAGFTLWVISVVAFVIMELHEGDAVDRHMAVCSIREDCHHEDYLGAIRANYGLDKPLYVQYRLWVSRIVLKGDVGPSFYPNREINNVITNMLILTLALLVSTSVFIWIASVPTGVYSAVRRRSLGDRAFSFFRIVGLNVPDFLLALLLMYFAFFGGNAGGLLSGEYINAPWSAAKVFDLLQHLIWPSVVLGAAGVAKQSSLLRDTLLDELDKPYLAAVRARGAPSWRVIAKYPARMAAARLIVGFRGLLPGLVSGTVIVSVVMSLQTHGWLIERALLDDDTYLYGAAFLILCAIAVVGALVCDLVLGAVDPRVRLQGSADR